MDRVLSSKRCWLLTGAEFDEGKTLAEIEKIRPLFPTSCATLVEQGICPNYCREGVRRRNSDPLLTNTTPCGVWLTRVRDESSTEVGDLASQIGMVEEVRRAYFQLKAYHEYEDSLFFDTFDFEQYEKELSSNCEIIAASLRERSPLPFAGYLPVKIPKKLDDDGHLVYRKMVYSTVYDQIPIQAVFNVVGPIIERSFQASSYGYRWNTDKHNVNSIFDDWREAYPRFRREMLATLRGNKEGFHICCDIKGFYDHIDQAALVEQLRSIIKDINVLNYIKEIISLYHFDDTGPKGLPQGPAYARILANLYLNDFDQFASDHTIKYLRYVDDLFLFFNSKDDAERGLNEVVQYLGRLGLELSEAEDKKPILTPNTDESRVKKLLDKIQYGMLEGTRQLRHLDQQVVSDFSDAVARGKASPGTNDELIKLNDYLPSLLYVVTEDALKSHPLRKKVWDIVNYLIKHKVFFPKRLKKVFYRLLDLSPSDRESEELYEALDPTHKVYFILSVYGTYFSSGKHRELLEQLSRKATDDLDEFVCGFGLTISNRLGLSEKLGLASVVYIKRLISANSYFAPLKWTSAFSYLSLEDDERAAVRELINPASKSLLKAITLMNLGGEPRTYLDGKYLCNIIDGGDALLLPAVCSCIVSVTDMSDFLKKLLDLATMHPTLKASVVALISDKLFNNRLRAGRAQVANLRAIYEQIDDPEIRRILITGLIRISEDGGHITNEVDFAKDHQILARYNECFLFKKINQSIDYDCLELIPSSPITPIYNS